MVRHYMTTARHQISYGFDVSRGFFVVVSKSGKVQVSYFSIVTDFTGLSGVLDALVEVEAFPREQVQEALCAVLFMASANDIDDSDLRMSINLIENLKQAACECV